MSDDDKNYRDKPIKVLFADDNKDTLTFLVFLAKQRGWLVDTVTSARAIINAVNEKCFEGQDCYDCIVADINYGDDNRHGGPRFSGVGAAREVRKNFPNLPIIFVSGFISSLVRQEIRDIHGEIMIKPADPEKLFDKIEAMITWHRDTRLQYSGEERRKNSINRGDYTRRGTDIKKLSVPKVINDTLSEIRAEALAKGNGGGDK